MPWWAVHFHSRILAVCPARLMTRCAADLEPRVFRGSRRLRSVVIAARWNRAEVSELVQQLDRATGLV